MRKIHFILLFVSFIWGTSFIATQIVLQECSVFTLLTCRLAIATTIFLFILLFRKEWKKKVTAKDILYFFITGLLSVSLYQLLQTTANKLSNASITSLFITVHPIFLCMFGMIFFKEKLTARKVIGIMFGFFGSIIIATKGQFTLTEGTNYIIALFCIFLNSVMWAGYSTISKKLSKRYNSFDVTALMTIFGTIFFLPIVFPLGRAFNINVISEIFSMSARASSAIIYLAVTCTILGYSLWAYSIKRLEISKAGYYLYLEPVFTILVAPFFVGNQLRSYLIIGGVIIFIGLFLINLHKISLWKKRD